MKTTRITLLVALLLAVTVLSWLAAHPGLYAGHVSRIITQNLLRQTGASFRYETLEGNVLGDLRLLAVDLSWQGLDGSFAYLQADTLEVSYDLSDLLKGRVHLYRLAMLSARGMIRRHHLDAPAEKHRRGPPELPRLAVEEGVLRGLDLRVIQSDGSEDHLQDLGWWGSVRTRKKKFIVDTRALSGSWPQRNFTVRSVWGRTEVSPAGITVANLRVATDSTRVQINGDWSKEEGPNLKVDVDRFCLGEILNLMGKPDPIVVDLSGNATVTGFTPLEVSGQVSGVIDHYSLTDTEFGLVADGSDLQITRAKGLLFGSPVELRGKVDASTGELALRGQVENLDLSQPWTTTETQWPESKLSGSVDLRVVAKSPVWVDLTAKELRGQIAELAVDSLSGQVHFREDRGTRFDALRVLTNHTWIEGSGTLDSLNVLDLPFSAQASDLAAWRSAYALPWDHSGGMRAQGRFSGPVEAPNLQIEGVLDSLSGFRMSGSEIHARLKVSPWNDLGKVEGQVEAAEFRLGGVRLGRLEGQFQRDYPTITVPHLEVSEGDSVLSLSGKVEQEEGRALLSIDSASFALGPRQWILSEPGKLELGKGWVQSHGLSVRSASGGWTIRGGVDSLGVMDLRVDLMDGDLGLLPHLGIGPPDLEGTLEGHVVLQGRREDPDLTIDVRGKQLTGFGRRVERLRLLTAVHGSQVALDSLQVLSPQGELSLTGSLALLRDDALQWLTQNPERWRELLAPAQPNLVLAFHDMNSRYWMEPQAKDENLGRITAALSIQGTLERPLIQGEGQITNLVSAGGTIVFPTLRSRIESDGMSLRLGHGIILTPDPWLRFNVVLPLRFSAVHAPQWAGSEGAEVELTSDGEVELRRLGPILPMLSEISGKAELLYRARGSMDHPQIEGYLRVHDGIAQLEGSLERLREIDIDAPIEDGVMKIQKFTAREGLKGTVNATGEVQFDGLLPDDIQMDIQADRFLFASILHLRALLRTNDLHMSLKRPAPHLARRPYFSGTIDVIKARYTGEFDNRGGGEALGATTAPDWLA
ncbi:MAG TPA: hypothetical protein VKA63_12090, partial [Candidatus Krumholzibacteria bacterium]|nr:hypothetical protein [Candidatus Krumholzibacteria bacterium]